MEAKAIFIERLSNLGLDDKGLPIPSHIKSILESDPDDDYMIDDHYHERIEPITEEEIEEVNNKLPLIIETGLEINDKAIHELDFETPYFHRKENGDICSVADIESLIGYSHKYPDKIGYYESEENPKPISSVYFQDIDNWFRNKLYNFCLYQANHNIDVINSPYLIRERFNFIKYIPISKIKALFFDLHNRKINIDALIVLLKILCQHRSEKQYEKILEGVIVHHDNIDFVRKMYEFKKWLYYQAKDKMVKIGLWRDVINILLFTISSNQDCILVTPEDKNNINNMCLDLLYECIAEDPNHGYDHIIETLSANMDLYNQSKKVIEYVYKITNPSIFFTYYHPYFYSDYDKNMYEFIVNDYIKYHDLFNKPDIHEIVKDITRQYSDKISKYVFEDRNIDKFYLIMKLFHKYIPNETIVNLMYVSLIQERDDIGDWMIENQLINKSQIDEAHTRYLKDIQKRIELSKTRMMSKCKF